jgi:hypothetical protein
MATLAGMAALVAAIGPGRSREGKRTGTIAVELGAAPLAGTDTAKASERSWMRHKTS